MCHYGELRCFFVDALFWHVDCLLIRVMKHTTNHNREGDMKVDWMWVRLMEALDMAAVTCGQRTTQYLARRLWNKLFK